VQAELLVFSHLGCIESELSSAHFLSDLQALERPRFTPHDRPGSLHSCHETYLMCTPPCEMMCFSRTLNLLHSTACKVYVEIDNTPCSAS
jgi:hypothetical protein